MLLRQRNLASLAEGLVDHDEIAIFTRLHLSAVRDAIFSAVQARSYDVSPDGRRFLVINDMPATDQASTATPASMVVVLNWHEELKARLPSN